MSKYVRYRHIQKYHWEQYPVEETVTLIKRINEISQAGKRRIDVVTTLEKDFEVVTPVDEKEQFGPDINKTVLPKL